MNKSNKRKGPSKKEVMNDGNEFSQEEEEEEEEDEEEPQPKTVQKPREMRARPLPVPDYYDPLGDMDKLAKLKRYKYHNIVGNVG